MFQFKMYRKLAIRCASVVALVLVLAHCTFAHLPAALSSILKHNDETRMAKTNWRHNDNQSLDLYTPDQLEIVETYLIGGDTLINQQSLAQADHAVMVVQLLSKPYITTFTHWYEDREQDLYKWGGPEANQELCLQQLEDLNRRLQRHYEEKRSGKDTNLYQLLDTYEWYGSGTYLGNNEWLGNYNECLRLKINSTEGLLATRYCSGAFKHSRWPQGTKVDQLMSMRAGVCLPKSCDSIRYKNKFQLIENLVNFKARKVDEGDVYLDYLYCLPDEQSRARLWYYSPKTVAFVGVLLGWIGLLMYSTIKFDSFSKAKPQSDVVCKNYHIYKSLSVVENAKSLLKTQSPIQKKDAGEKIQIVNLDVVEGIKVLTMCYVITGHTLMCFTQITNNGREMSRPDLSNVIFLAADRLPGLTVNVFFSITGILTAYLLFKTTKPIKFITSPLQWIVFVALRYIRIMPLYVLVVAYEKYLAKYTGSGPLWDYGTSSLSPRTRCEQESWLYTLFFAANLKHPLASCIPAAWYLGNDFQFFLVTPIFLALLEKRPKLGKLVSIGVILIGSSLAAIRIASSGHDLSPMIKFLPHGFNIYLYFLGDTYTFPHYRIPAYLCGLLFGHALYQYEQQRMSENKDDLKTKIDWPEWMKKFGIKLFLLTIVSCVSVPLVRQLLPRDRFYSSVIVGFMTPAYNLLFAFTGGLYVVLAATGHGNQAINGFLASPIWKVLSRLNLCVLLINVCVLNYFAQTATHLIYFDFKIMAALYLFSIFMSYLVAAVVCVFFESPLRNFINMYLMAPLKGQLKKEHED